MQKVKRVKTNLHQFNLNSLFKGMFVLPIGVKNYTNFYRCIPSGRFLISMNAFQRSSVQLKKQQLKWDLAYLYNRIKS